ncbi:hypothetical protein NIES4071_04820 [Calothrix sp. NIES-4071]|nr:hypothetical protein NIES4071_04820 [Calothrix sp. NIES-4071]BAZ54828.1 hypothetical protein NIES4105_04810 [Calothrix sp. NIES-4105]
MVPVLIFWFANSFLSFYTGGLIGIGFLSSIVTLPKLVVAPVIILLGDFVGAALWWLILIIWELVENRFNLPKPPDNIGTFLLFIIIMAGFGLVGLATGTILAMSSRPKRRISLILSLIALFIVGLANTLQFVIK